MNQKFGDGNVIGGVIVGGKDAMAEDRVEHFLASITIWIRSFVSSGGRLE